MSRSKVKSIIILILLLFNLFLLSLVGFLQLRSFRYEQSALDATVSILAESGVTVATDLTPIAMELPLCSAARDSQREEELVRLLGGSEAAQASFLANGRFSIAFTPALPPEEGVSRTEQASRLLDTLGLEGEQFLQTENQVTAVQTLEGVPVFSTDTALSFAYDDRGALSSISGRLILGKTTELAQEQQPASLSTILLSFHTTTSEWLDVYQTIELVEPAYLVRIVASQTQSVRLQPVWHIVTDTGAYCVDAYNADVIRMD